MLWQAHAGKLWARFTIALRRALAATLGVKGSEFREHARISYAKVAEYQPAGSCTSTPSSASTEDRKSVV